MTDDILFTNYYMLKKDGNLHMQAKEPGIGKTYVKEWRMSSDLDRDNLDKSVHRLAIFDSKGDQLATEVMKCNCGFDRTVKRFAKIKQMLEAVKR